MSGLRFGPPGPNPLMICIDMQRLFLEPGPWHTPAGHDILPTCVALARARPEASLFTRFLPARSAETASGSWARYYRHWEAVTLERTGPETVDLVAPLLGLAAPERVFDKTTYDAFDAAPFARAIAAATPSALVFTGIETDVCVLASVLSAVDLGYRCLLVTDAVAGSDPQAHSACLAHVYPRFDQQVEMLTTAELMPHWAG
ncbi:cysteine hydrolase [Paroceanicella profunda]|uniref:Cysteine hydrolase n=1 Tax=Paroceanicella profunda TaxID=2579971 RepID=A0A5B8G3J2_9RHOB|nr:isochorismatase family cysteine hydrolase [Paroceanicella profunda]QDL93363.1 cysteine hydrolase [Paroceanicella profunda]